MAKSPEGYQPSESEVLKAEEMKTGEQESASEAREREKEKLREVLAKTVQEHPEVLDAAFTPQMIAAFARHLETPSKEVFVTYLKVSAGAGYRPSKMLTLWMDKPKLTKDAYYINPGASPSLAESDVHTPRSGMGGIEALTDDTEQALEDLSRDMELVNKEATNEVELDRLGFDKAQAFLYTFRRKLKE